MVIDFCAGAGGKTLALGAMMRSTGRLYAFDVSAARLAKAKPRLARSGLSNVYPVTIRHERDDRVARLKAKAHRVLVDAPCTGLGTLRRNPDLKWRQSGQELERLCEQQASILSQAARCVRPGGLLVYATCSFLPQENEQQIERFLAAHPDFELQNAAELLPERLKTATEPDGLLRLRPDRQGTDGFFAAAMRRSSTGTV
jgi:16S rRNA (cytosine967-C5)-methyltransferase